MNEFCKLSLHKEYQFMRIEQDQENVFHVGQFYLVTFNTYYEDYDELEIYIDGNGVSMIGLWGYEKFFLEFELVG